MNHSVVRLMIALLTLVSFASCQVGKKPVRKNVSIDKYQIKERYGINTVDTVAGDHTNTTTEAPSPINNEAKKGLAAFLLTLAQREIPFKTFSGKAKMHYASGDTKQEFVSHIRIRKDSVIWINVSAVGGMIQVARVFISPDSVFMVNYLQKEAHVLPIKDVSKLLPVSVDFKTLQNLIIGNALRNGSNATDVSDFGGTWSIELKDGEMSQQLAYNKADSSIRTLQMRTADNSTQGMMQYGAYEVIDDRKFSTQRVITIDNAGVSHYLDMSFNKAEFDTELDYPFSIPKKYDIK